MLARTKTQSNSAAPWDGDHPGTRCISPPTLPNLGIQNDSLGWVLKRALGRVLKRAQLGLSAPWLGHGPPVHQLRVLLELLAERSAKLGS